MRFIQVPVRLITLSVVGVGFLGSVGLTSFSQPRTPSDRDHSSPAIARVTWPNGNTRTLRFEGVGCAVSMCSRVRIQSKVVDSTAVNSTWLDSAASIKDITDQDALFVFKDGTVSRLPIISGNRYLYFANGKAEIGKFDSVEFLSR